MLDRGRAACAITVAAAALAGPLLSVSGASGRGDHGLDRGASATARVFATGEQLGQNAAQSPGDSGHHDGGYSGHDGGYSSHGGDGSSHGGDGSSPGQPPAGQTSQAPAPAAQTPAPAAQAAAPVSREAQAAQPTSPAATAGTTGEHGNHGAWGASWARGHQGSGRPPWAGGQNGQGNGDSSSTPSDNETSSATPANAGDQGQGAGGSQASQASRASQASLASQAGQASSAGSDQPHHDSAGGSGSQSGLVTPGASVAGPAASTSGSTLSVTPSTTPSTTPSGSSSPPTASTSLITLPSRLTSPATGKKSPSSSFTSSTRPISLTGTAAGGGGGLGLGAAFGRGGTSGSGLTGLGTGGLSPATAAVGLNGSTTPARSGATGTARAPHRNGHSAPSGGPLSGFPFTGPKAIERFVNVIPEAVWLALAASLLLAALGTGAAVAFRRQARRTEGHFAAVEAAALTDPLTGVLNRRGFTEAVERELARARRYRRPFVLAYVDVRGLKAVNDTEGHLAGDELLKTVAGLLTESARADDVVGRLGGDELGLLLAEQTADGAAVVTRRIEAQVPERSAALGLSAPWGLTIGTAAFPQDGETFDELIGTADRRLYEQRGIALRSS